MKIIAHRGASGYAPENTLAAFKKALLMNIDMIEFDVRALPSGEVILMHDHRLDRTTNGTSYVHVHSFDDLRRLNAGDNEIIPTLQEVLDLVNREVPVNIELKGSGVAKAVADIVKEYLEQGWRPADFFVSSFNHRELQEFKLLMPHIDIGALAAVVPLGYAAFASELNAAAVCLEDEFVDDHYIQDAHDRGLKVYVYTVNDIEEVQRFYYMGVDGVFSNYPDTARETLERLRAERSIENKVYI